MVASRDGYTVVGETYNILDFYGENGFTDVHWSKDGYEYRVYLYKYGEIVAEWDSLFETAYPDQPLKRPDKLLTK